MNRKLTQRNSFDPSYVMKMLASKDMPPEELKRVLNEACVVILGLRYDLASTLSTMSNLVETRQFWLTGKCAK